MIGQWVARFVNRRRGFAAITKFHLVESEVAERLVLRCGREFAPIEGSEIRDAAETPDVNLATDRCYHCGSR